MSEEKGNGWRDKFILSELERNTKSIKDMDTTLGNVQIEIAKLKITAGLWGAAAGSVPSFLAVLYLIFGVK